MKKIKATLSRLMAKKIRWILAFSVVAFVLFLVVGIQQKKEQEASRLLVDHTNLVIKKIDTVGLVFAEAEAAARSYLVTRDTSWEKQVYFLHTVINASVSSLMQLTIDNPKQQVNTAKLKNLCLQKEDFQIRLLSQNFTVDSIAEKIRMDGEGPGISRGTKQLLRNIREIEEGLLAERMSQNENSYRASIYTAFWGGIFALLLVLAILSQLNQDINLRKKAEQEVNASEEKYRNLIENAGAVMYTTDAIGLITFANNRVAELTEYTVEELSGKNFSFLIDPIWKEKVVTFYMNQFGQKKQSSHLAFLIKTKSGKNKWVDQSAQLLFEEDRIVGFQCMVKDITEQKLVEQELSRSEAKRKENEYRLNAIMDNSPALIYIKDLEGRYVLANKRFLSFFGLTSKQVIGHKDDEFTTKELADHYKKTDTQVISTREPIETEESIETPAGRKNLLLLKFPLLSPDHLLLGVSGIATDVTDKEEMLRQNQEALQKAESAQQIQEQFLANMSHEIRTPMNGIQGMTRLLLETKLSDEQKRFTNIISRSLNNLMVIVNNVLDFSSLKTGKFTIDCFAFDLPEIMDEVKKYFEPSLTHKDLRFILTIDKKVPRFVKGDAFRLKQVLTNLMGNAIKFTEIGNIQLAITLQEQTDEQSDILFTLSDTGIGIPKNKLDTIFESFAQAEKKISSGYGGAGLGLTISKGLIELQGGTISVESKEGSGSVFRFIIPFGRTTDEDQLATQIDHTETLAGKRILVVEDNPVNQRLIEFVLKKVKTVTDFAANGKEAITLCEKNLPYDLIIMDLQMPVMDGYETTIYLRSQLKLKTPIIAMTATALKEDQEKSVAVGMNDFMIKPFDFNDLYIRMNRLLHIATPEPEPIQKEMKETEDKLYDLSLLNELDDPAYVAEVITFFLASAPKDIKDLTVLLQEKDWIAVSKKAHKVKGSAAMLQSKKLAAMLSNIESDAKTGNNLEVLPERIKDVSDFFILVQKQLEEELKRLKK
jgi:PAS domain S-box-containing protein